MNSKIFHPKAGIIGSIIITLGLLVPILPYRGLEGERFSPINHFVSELGEYGVANLAFLFNASLIVGGICFLFFMISLLNKRRHKLIRATVFFGILASISTTLIGVFPVNNLEPHINSAAGLFIGGLVAITLFTIYILFDKKCKFPKWLILPGIMNFFLLGAFLILPEVYPDWVLDPHYNIRPDIWGYTIIEWFAIGGIVIWVGVVSLISTGNSKTSNTRSHHNLSIPH